MTLAQILQDFNTKLSKIDKLIQTAHRQDAVGSFVWDKYERSVITEAAFLRVFMTWESFLEESFLAYMLGKNSITGLTIIRYVLPRDIGHAREFVTGTLRYPDWSNPDTVKKLALVYFELGEPFKTTLNSIHSDLMDIKTIRNSAAHLTSATSTKLDAVALRKLQKPVIGISVYDLILARDPTSTINETILQTYLNKLTAGAKKIAEGIA